VKAGATFVWGLKRSGIHLVANWLYANLGGQVEGSLDADGLHPQLHDGFADAAAGVAYFNNCGGLHSRRFKLGPLVPSDFEVAAHRYPRVVFGVEDCRLELSSLTLGAVATHLLVLRDPLNNLASRLEGARTRPDVFRVDTDYVDLLAAYCDEFLGHTGELPRKTVVVFDRFVDDRGYRDAIAAELGLANVDAVSNVSRFGGGSSFGGADDVPVAERPSPAALTTRFRQHPIPGAILDRMLDKAVIGETCASVFGYDLAERAVEARALDPAADAVADA
jgi:hypothetical protein